MQCKLCGDQITARAGAVTCSAKCRVALYRQFRRADIPSALTAKNRWVLHDRRKVPRQVDGSFASSTDPETWTSFINAKERAAGRGLGFVLNGDGLACIDLDKCLVNGVLQPWAEKIVKAAGRTYIEVSPSGRGLHIWGKAKVGKGFRVNGVEVYDRARYITITQNRWADAPLRLQSIQALADRLITQRGTLAV